MNKGIPPEPDPQLRLESLEKQLRPLPPPSVPVVLPSKLIAGIPIPAPTSSLAVSVTKQWPWMPGIGAMGILILSLGHAWLACSNSNAFPESNANGSATDQLVTGQTAAVPTKTIRDCEQAVHIDPYNADAWFNLAKAQADMHRSTDAISSAQKAIDVARSRNRIALANTVEAWLRTYGATRSEQSSH
jgi:hypothetical protein